MRGGSDGSKLLWSDRSKRLNGQTGCWVDAVTRDARQRAIISPGPHNPQWCGATEIAADVQELASAAGEQLAQVKTALDEAQHSKGVKSRDDVSLMIDNAIAATTAG